MTTVRILSFVNHIAPAADIQAAIDRAFEWGVDAIVAQGTGKDWGAYWQGSGQQMDTHNFKNNVRPYIHAALQHRVPFIFSVGIAGADVHVDECLERVDELAVEEGWALNIGLIRSELPVKFVSNAISAGRRIHRAVATDALPEELSVEHLEGLVSIVALLGPEPILDLLETGGIDGIITGRSVDIALFMAPALLRGMPRAVAAAAGKVLECGGLALTPGDPARCLWAQIDEGGFEVRSPNPGYSVTPQGMAALAFYERADPNQEKNPGGVLDLSDCTYTALPDGGVRCSGASWTERPYTVLVEGVRLMGYRAITIVGVREQILLDQLDSWLDGMHSALALAPRFGHLRPGVDYRVTPRIYGRDGVLGPLEARRLEPSHEVGVVIDVVAGTPELASQIAYFAFIRLFLGPYPGRQTTSGNVAVPFMPLTIPVGPVYDFVLYHEMPLSRPDEAFRISHVRFPRGGAHAAA
jgi:hypothetical protein